MRIVVTSQCQTSGLTVALRMLLPDAEVNPFTYAGLTAVEHETLAQQLTEAEVWVVTAPTSFIETIQGIADLSHLRILTMPELYFDAFHPDLVYAWLPNATTLDTPAGPYNSAIVLWAWRHQLDVSETIALFTPAVFAGLAYTTRWNLSTARMKSDFEAHGLDYRQFLLPLQRRGVFMHTVNHPRVTALAQLGRLAASRLGARPELLAEPIEDFMTDALMAASAVWPVYPSIANALGMKGSYTWKLPDQRVIRLDEFVEGSYEMYGRVDASEFACGQLDWPMYDPVLTEAAQGVTR